MKNLSSLLLILVFSVLTAQKTERSPLTEIPSPESLRAGAFIDVNSNKLGNTVVKRNEKLVKLMNSVGEMKLGDYKDNTIDAFGDAYEFLMGMYASNAGKSGGEYYTPQEVSELLTHLTLVGKSEVNKVYDPACGSRVIIMITANSNDRIRLLSPLLNNKINHWCAA